MVTNQDLKKLIIPLFLEQLLVALVGIADVFVIGFVGEAAVSGVSLVNAFNMIFINPVHSAGIRRCGGHQPVYRKEGQGAGGSGSFPASDGIGIAVGCYFCSGTGCQRTADAFDVRQG